MNVVGDELARLREQPATEAELDRARENVKARVILALESTGARMNRLGASLLFGLPLLEADEVMARVDAVTLDDLRALAPPVLRHRLLVGFRGQAEGVTADSLVAHLLATVPDPASPLD
jgi:predicted Zn-dependent peptidase